MLKRWSSIKEMRHFECYDINDSRHVHVIVSVYSTDQLKSTLVDSGYPVNTGTGELVGDLNWVKKKNSR